MLTPIDWTAIGTNTTVKVPKTKLTGLIRPPGMAVSSDESGGDSGQTQVAAQPARGCRSRLGDNAEAGQTTREARNGERQNLQPLRPDGREDGTRLVLAHRGHALASTGEAQQSPVPDRDENAHPECERDATQPVLVEHDDKFAIPGHVYCF